MNYLFRCLLLWIIVGPINVTAQTTTEGFVLSGKLFDAASRQPITYATINLLNEKKELLASTYSDERGHFKIDKLAVAASWIELSATGYGSILRELKWPAGSKTLQLDNLELSIAHNNLETVTVTGRKRIVEQRPGMLVYRAGNDPSNQGGTAADVLRKAPVLSVDAQGNVSMRGSGSIRILINGKFSGQMARSPADALNMIPASIIESVEIVTTPSVKYDAEGTAGVINIITKKGTKDFTGAIEITGSNLNQMLNPRFEFTTGKWNLSFHGHLHQMRTKNTTVYERLQLNNGVTGNSLYQEKESDNKAPHGSADITVVFNPDSVSEWSLGVNTRIGKWPGNSDISTSSRLADGSIAEFYRQQMETSDRYLATDINLSYNRKFSRPGKELTVQVQWSPGKSSGPYYSRLTDKDGMGFYEERNDNDIRNNELTIQADFVQPLNKIFVLETGLKSILRRAKNTYTVTADDGSGWMVVDDRSDRFVNRQDVWAGYGLLKATLSKNWYAEAGLRIEATNMEGDLRKEGTSFGRDFNNLVPTATITRKINADQNLTLSYTKRITRPFIFDMNPNINASDPKNLSTGNPDLAPEITHQVEMVHGLNLGTAFFLNSSVYWRKTEDAIVEFTNTDPNGISITRKENLAGNRSLGMNLSATSTPVVWWSLNSNVNINHLKFASDVLAIIREGWAADFDLNTSFKLPRRYSIQAAGSWNTRKIDLQGYSSYQFYYSAAVKKEWANPKLVVTLLAVNPFNQYIPQQVEMATAQFRAFSNNRYYLREMKLTLNWEFGRRSGARQRNKISNDDVKGPAKG